MKANKTRAILGIATVAVGALVSVQSFARPVRVVPDEFPVFVVAGGRYVPGDLILGEQLIVTLEGNHLRLYNADSVPQSITSVDHRNGMPLFDSGLVAPDASARVDGLNELPPGDYRFTSVTRPANLGVVRIMNPGDDTLDAGRILP